MSEFVKPVRKVLPIQFEVKSLIKDLCSDEEICPTCHGMGVILTNNPYGLKDDPNKQAGMFPYRHQSFVPCPTCFHGIIKLCPHCGKPFKKGCATCDCSGAIAADKTKEAEKYLKALELAEKHEPSALGTVFVMACSEFYTHNEGYFQDWSDFFDDWNENHLDCKQRPQYVWATDSERMSFNAYDIVEHACEDMYEDAMSDIDADAIKELQDYLDKWEKQNGVTSYFETHKHAIRIPWEDYKQE